MTRTIRAALACAALSTTSACAVRSPAISGERPVIVNNRVVDPVTCDVLERISGIDDNAFAMPDPDRPGVFKIWNFGIQRFDVATRRWVPPRLSEIELKGTRVRRLDAQGLEVWSTSLEGEPANDGVTAVGERTVFAVLHRSLHALDRATGRELWRAPAPGANQDLVLVGQLVFTAGADTNLPRRWEILGRSQTTGEVVVRWRLPDPSHPWITRVGRFVVVMVNVAPTGLTRVYDDKGAIVLSIDEEASGVFELNGGILVTTRGFVSRYAPDMTLVWSRQRDQWESQPALDRIDMSSYLLVAWGARGVNVTRFQASDGTIMWDVVCEAQQLDCGSWQHEAYAEVRSEKVIVVGQGRGPSFLTALDLKTGQVLWSWDYAP